MTDQEPALRAVVPTLRYPDADAAVDWLVRAFGFEPHAVYRDDDGRVVHAQLKAGTGMIMVGPPADTPFARWRIEPGDTGGRETQTCYVVVAGVDAHCRRAEAEGADILLPPRDQDYGGRDYTCRDPQGHIWSFGDYDPWSAGG